jgi:hypothetical protein
MLELRFKEKLEEVAANGSALNLHSVHCEFVKKLMASTEGGAHLMPTAKEKKAKTTTPCPIVNFDAIPTSDQNQFFQRTVFYSEWHKRTNVKIYHSVLMKETVHTVKTKIFDWLKMKNMHACRRIGFGQNK